MQLAELLIMMVRASGGYIPRTFGALSGNHCSIDRSVSIRDGNELLVFGASKFCLLQWVPTQRQYPKEEGQGSHSEWVSARGSTALKHQTPDKSRNKLARTIKLVVCAHL